ncbi:hypothetical protein PM082_013767 [Marasmius tenuissimus]|nr:hypothetical protein PM082_013767 [Marasmius tenuissimus]
MSPAHEAYIVQNFVDRFNELKREVDIVLQTHNVEQGQTLTREVVLFQQRLQQHYRLFQPDEMETMTDSALHMILYLDDMRNTIVDPPDRPFPFPETPNEPQRGPGQPRKAIDPNLLRLAVDMRRTKRLADILQVHVRTLRRRALEEGLVEPGEPVYVEFETEEGLIMRVYRSSTGPVSDISDHDLDEAMKSIIVAFPSFGRRLIQGHLKFMGIHIPRSQVQASYGRVVGLIRYKIVIHAFVNGFSRMVTGIQASNNNRAATVLDVFLEAIQIHGCPSRVRGDHGTENGMVCEFMETLRGTGRGSYLYGKSIHNIRIERLWRDVTLGFGAKWKYFFQDLEVNESLDVNNNNHIWLLQHLFLHAINNDARVWAESWNRHPITLRQQRSQSLAEMFVFRMMENGMRGMEEIANVNDDHLVDLSAQEDRDAYGIDWQEMEDNTMVDHHNQANPPDSEDATNPFDTHIPDHFSHVEVESPDCPLSTEQLQSLNDILYSLPHFQNPDMDSRRLGSRICLCTHSLDEHPQVRAPSSLPPKGGTDAGCTGFYISGGELTPFTACSRPNCGQVYLSHNPIETPPSSSSSSSLSSRPSIASWQPPSSQIAPAPALSLSAGAGTSSAFGSTPWVTTRNISVPRDGHVTSHEAMSGINGRQLPLPNHSKPNLFAQTARAVKSKSTASSRIKRDDFDGAMQIGEYKTQTVTFFFLPFVETTLMPEDHQLFVSQFPKDKRPGLRLWPAVLEPILRTFKTFHLSYDYTIRARSDQENLFPTLYPVLVEYLNSHGFRLYDHEFPTEPPTDGTTPLMMCRVGRNQVKHGSILSQDVTLNPGNWTLENILRTTGHTNMQISLDRKQILFISFPQPLSGPIGDYQTHPCFAYHLWDEHLRIRGKNRFEVTCWETCPAPVDVPQPSSSSSSDESSSAGRRRRTDSIERSPSPPRQRRRYHHLNDQDDAEYVPSRSVTPALSSSSIATRQVHSITPAFTQPYSEPAMPPINPGTISIADSALGAIQPIPAIAASHVPASALSIIPAPSPVSIPTPSPVLAPAPFPVAPTPTSSPPPDALPTTISQEDLLSVSEFITPSVWRRTLQERCANITTGFSLQSETLDNAADAFIGLVMNIHGGPTVSLPEKTTVRAFDLQYLLMGDHYTTIGKTIDGVDRIDDGTDDGATNVIQRPGIGPTPVKVLLRRCIEKLVENGDYFKDYDEHKTWAF